MIVKAEDPITSLFGAFGKYIYDNGISLNDIDKVMLTGVGSAYVNQPLYGLSTDPVSYTHLYIPGSWKDSTTVGLLQVTKGLSDSLMLLPVPIHCVYVCLLYTSKVLNFNELRPKRSAIICTIFLYSGESVVEMCIRDSLHNQVHPHTWGPNENASEKVCHYTLRNLFFQDGKPCPWHGSHG